MIGEFFFTRGGDVKGPDFRMIRLSAGTAFGFDHPATILTLQAVSDTVSQFCGRRVLDIGCGSGILSILMHRLGAKKVFGIDIDPHVVCEAAGNARRCRRSKGKILMKLRDISLFRDPFPYIAANVPLNVHECTAPHAQRLLEKGGVLVAGGIMEGQMERLMLLYNECEKKALSEREGWLSVIFHKVK